MCVLWCLPKAQRAEITSNSIGGPREKLENHVPHTDVVLNTLPFHLWILSPFWRGVVQKVPGYGRVYGKNQEAHA